MFPPTSLAERGQRLLPPPLCRLHLLLSGLVTHHLCSTKLGLHTSNTYVLSYRFIFLGTPVLRTPRLGYLFPQFISIRLRKFLPQNSESHHNRPSHLPHIINLILLFITTVFSSFHSSHLPPTSHTYSRSSPPSSAIRQEKASKRYQTGMA